MAGFVQPALIQAIAEVIGIGKLDDDAAGVLAPDVEYKLREVLQDAGKFARHARRARLLPEDINAALQARGLEQLYGLHTGDRRRYAAVAGSPGAFRVAAALHSSEDVMFAPLPPAPVEGSLQVHWLLIGGVKPRTPENLIPQALVQKFQQRAKEARQSRQLFGGTGGRHGATGGVLATTNGQSVARAAAPEASSRTIPVAMPATLAAVDQDGALAPLLPLAQHIVTEEERALLQAVAEAVVGEGRDDAAARAAYACLAADPGLEQVVPYLVGLVAEHVRAGLGDAGRLERLLQAADALVANRGNNLGPHLPGLLPALMTCMLAARLGSPRALRGCHDRRVRRTAARLLLAVASRFPDPQLDIAARICSACMAALLDAAKPLSTHYGALVGMRAMGPRTSRLVLLPHAPLIFQRLLPVIRQSRKVAKQNEAWHCLGALQEVVCACCQDAVARCSAVAVHPALLAKAAFHVDRPSRLDRWHSGVREVREQRVSEIDQRMKALQAEAERQRQAAVSRQEARRRQAERLVGVEADALAAARAELQERPGSGGGRASLEGDEPGSSDGGGRSTRGNSDEEHADQDMEEPGEPLVVPPPADTRHPSAAPRPILNGAPAAAHGPVSAAMGGSGAHGGGAALVGAGEPGVPEGSGRAPHANASDRLGREGAGVVGLGPRGGAGDPCGPAQRSNGLEDGSRLGGSEPRPPAALGPPARVDHGPRGKLSALVREGAGGDTSAPCGARADCMSPPQAHSRDVPKAASASGGPGVEAGGLADPDAGVRLARGGGERLRLPEQARDAGRAGLIAKRNHTTHEVQHRPLLVADTDAVDVLHGATAGQHDIAGIWRSSYEMFGESVLAWVPLGELSHTFL